MLYNIIICEKGRMYMAKCIFKTVALGYSKEEVAQYILKMSDAAKKEVEAARSQTDIYKEENAKLKEKLKLKNTELKRLKERMNENA